jgi:hypothetical protein
MQDRPPLTVDAAFRRLLRNPRETLFRQWNWKAALFSSFFRAVVFFAVNLRAGWTSAWAAMLTEFVDGGEKLGHSGGWKWAIMWVTVRPSGSLKTAGAATWLGFTWSLSLRLRPRQLVEPARRGRICR